VTFSEDSQDAPLPQRLAWLEAQLDAPRLRRIALGAAALGARLGTLSSDAEARRSGAASAAAAQLAALAPPLRLVLAAAGRLGADLCALGGASGCLASQLLRLFASLQRDGFCAPAAAAGEGEAGGKLLDEQGGTGMGAGEGRKDVSDEIEDEEQILGMEDLERGDAAPPEAEEAKGIEMKSDFAGEETELDREEAGEEDAEEAEADQLDREVRARPSRAAPRRWPFCAARGVRG